MVSSTSAAVGITVLAGVYILYRLALPKPLPGIPYNVGSTSRLFGDIPDLVSFVSKGGNFIEWMADQQLKSNSVIKQVFIRPFGKPMILLADHRESREIMVYRASDFDRSNDVVNMLRPVVRTNQFAQPTGPQWKLHRRLVQDTMSQAFLNDAVAPSIHASVMRLIDLWKHKLDLTQGRPFSAADDLFLTAFDAVAAFTFGSSFPHSALKSQVDGLRSLDMNDLAGGTTDDPVEFPSFGIDESISSMIRLVDGIETAQSSPSPSFSWFMTKHTKWFRRASGIKDQCIRDEIEKAAASIKQIDDDASLPQERHAIDHIINREKKLALKEGREPDLFAGRIIDELYGLILAGHDTTSTTMCWTVKLLAQYPVVQKNLRNALLSAFPDAKAEGRCPTAREMAASVPYLDAVIEETLRYRPTAPIGTRDAIRDTSILGHPIPRGTTVVWLVISSGFLRPSLKVDEGQRTARAQEENEKGLVTEWDEDDISLFKPERWLVPHSSGTGFAFDANAGPSTPFGLGLRSCFGKRLAQVEMKIILTLLIWNFELLSCPEALSGHECRFALTYKPQKCYVRLKKIV